MSDGKSCDSIIITTESLSINKTSYHYSTEEPERSDSTIFPTESLSINTTSYYYPTKPTEEPEGPIGAHRCRSQPNLPLYMVMSGGATLMFWLLYLAGMACKHKICKKDIASRADKKDQPAFIYIAGIAIMLVAFVLGKYC